MKEDKIIQIIPTSQELHALFLGEDTDGEYANTSPIVCIALVEDSEGYRRIVPMCLYDYDSDIDDPRLCDDFKKFVFKPIQSHKGVIDKLKLNY